MNVFKQIDAISEPLQSLVYYGILIGFCFLTGLIINFIFYKFLWIYNRKRNSTTLNFLYQYTQRPLHFFYRCCSPRYFCRWKLRGSIIP